jgi:hypothetical protein
MRHSASAMTGSPVAGHCSGAPVAFLLISHSPVLIRSSHFGVINAVGYMRVAEARIRRAAGRPLKIGRAAAQQHDVGMQPGPVLNRLKAIFGLGDKLGVVVGVDDRP